MDLYGILAERKTTHGEYNDDARAAMALVDALLLAEMERENRKQDPLSDTQRHSLYMILFKVARIVAGDANLPDHWDDIQGYAKLVSDRLPRAPSAAKRTVLKEVEEPTGCADDCTHPSHRHGRPGRRSDEQVDCIPDIRKALADEQNEMPMKKPPCACPLPGYCLAESRTPPKYAYCRKAENADRIVPRYETPDLCVCAPNRCIVDDIGANPVGVCRRREWQKATAASSQAGAGTPSASPA